MMRGMRRRQAHAGEGELVRLANGELSPERARTVDAHLDACCACRSLFVEIQRTLDDYHEARLAALDAQAPPIEQSRAMLLERLAAARTEPAAGPGRFLHQPASVRWALGLAAFAVAVGIVTLFSGVGPAPTRPSGLGSDAAFVPDRRLTPGLAASVTLADVCPAESSELIAAVDPALADEVFRLHGVVDPRPRSFEIDYLIPPELGGATDVRNLWPQPYNVSPWNAYAKDALEDSLLQAVCERRMTLEAAQRALAEDWIAAYKAHFGAQEPLVEHASFLKDEPWE